MTERQKQVLALILFSVLLFVVAVMVSKAPAEVCAGECCGEQIAVLAPDGNPTPIWQRTPPPTRVPRELR